MDMEKKENTLRLLKLQISETPLSVMESLTTLADLVRDWALFDGLSHMEDAVKVTPYHQIIVVVTGNGGEYNDKSIFINNHFLLLKQDVLMSLCCPSGFSIELLVVYVTNPAF